MHTPLSLVIKLNAQTFAFDDKLPRLPVPNLNETFQLYYKSIQALISEDLDNLKNYIEEFLESEQSQKLQNALISRSNFIENWLETWWLEEAYLKSREPLIPYWNISGRSALNNSVWPIIDNYINVYSDEIIRRASRFAYALIKFWACLRKELVVPTKTRDEQPMSMSQMRVVFNTCRVPGVEKDSIVNFFRTEYESDAPSHIVLGCNGRIFMIKCVSKTNDILCPESIYLAMKEIADFCEKNGPGQSLATLTSLPRSDWAKYYDSIRKMSNKNAVNIDLIQQSIFWICLNNQHPPHPNMLLEKSMKVDCRNTWADKSFYVSFFSNGAITFGADHAPMDGIALVLAVTFAEEEIICGKGAEICKLDILNEIKQVHSHVNWTELTFDLPYHFDGIIDQAHSLFLNLCRNIEAQTFLFSTFSRKISRSYKLHPDTVFQLFLQLAYVRIHGISNPASVYETANTRQFLRGRTETIRSCTTEAVEWMKAIIEFGPRNSKVIPLFLKAHKAHNNLRHLCEMGKGFDRHIFGLIMASRIAPQFHSPLLDRIINHPSWTASGANGNFLLSTSPTGASNCMGAVAPMCPNGYGVFYRIVEDNCEAAVTSWCSDGQGKGSRLLEELNCCFSLLPLMYQEVHKTRL